MSLKEQLSTLRAGNIAKLPEDIVSKILHNEVKRLSLNGSLLNSIPICLKANISGVNRTLIYKYRKLIEEAKLEGVHVTACKGGADQLGVTTTLEGLDIEVVYQDDPLTKILKDGEKLLTL